MIKDRGASVEVEKLKMNYNALSELNNDIKNYRIKASKDAEWSLLLSEVSSVLKKIAAHD